MPWIYLDYCGQQLEDGDRIKPHLCHPHAARPRIEYVREKYGVLPTARKVLANNHLDVGGMVRVGEPCITVPVGVERTISVFTYQIDSVLDMLALSRPLTLAGHRYRIVCRWPGVLVIVSEADKQKVTRALKPLADPDAYGKHTREMLGVLEHAQHLLPGTLAMPVPQAKG